MNYCRLWFHDWSAWTTETVLKYRYGADRTEVYGSVQYKVCHRCGLRKEK